MKNRIVWALAWLATVSACTQSPEAGEGNSPSPAITATRHQPSGDQSVNIPKAADFTAAPMHNRIRVELAAPVADVWALVGDISRLPEYSSGLERVEVKPAGAVPAEFICHFKPLEPGGQRVLHRASVPWYEPGLGFVSIDEEPNAFDLTNTFSLTLLQPAERGTIVTWVLHYDAADLETNKANYDQALSDIATQLVERFGGRLLERHVE